MQENQEKLDRIETNFKEAMSEFIRQSGYVEGTLDTLIAMMVDTNPEVSMTSDRLIKTFHAIEGICKQGFLKEFNSVIELCKSLITENKELCSQKSVKKQEVKKNQESTIDLDKTIELLNKVHKD